MAKCNYLEAARKLMIFTIAVDLTWIIISIWLAGIEQTSSPVATFLTTYGFYIVSLCGISFYIAVLLVIMHLQKK